MANAERQAREFQHAQVFFKSLGGRYKRIRKRCKGKPHPDWYRYKIEKLTELETLSQHGLIDLFYGDETAVCSEGYVPYGWQFPNETVHIPVEKGYKLNVFGLISRINQTHWATTEENINSAFVFDQLEKLSMQLNKQTVVVLDNARIHTAKRIQYQLPYWQQRGLFVFYLPPYSPHLNLAETLWRKLKTQWLDPENYLDKETLFYAVNRFMANLGTAITINFSEFNAN